MIDIVDSKLTIDYSLSGPKFKTGRVVSLLDPSMKYNTASILTFTRVRTISFKRNYPCACPINCPSGYSGKHIDSP